MRILNYKVLLQKEPEGGYTVIVPILPGCVTYGETIEEAKKMAKDAISLYIESLTAHNEEIPIEDKRKPFTQPTKKLKENKSPLCIDTM